MTDPMTFPEPAPETAARVEKTEASGRWFRLRELIYVAVLLLTLVGVAITSFSKRPIIGYWEVLAPIVGLACIATGWPHALDRRAKARLVGTQALHWGAFLVAMNLLLLNNVQRMLNADATGLSIMLLLALGTFIAGIHIFAWEICVLGLVMALCVPAIAWIEQSALILSLGVLVAAALAFVFWWNGKRAMGRGI